MTDSERSFEKSLQAHLETMQGVKELAPVIEQIKDILVDLIERDGRLLLCGNGGSAADSQHWATEWTVRFEKDRRALSAIALTVDTSALTAIGNDLGFDRLFSRQVEAIGRKGDVLVALSTSGNSENILEAVKVAKDLGITTIGFTGRGGGKLAKMVDVPLVIVSDTTSRIQEAHEFIMHVLCELVDQELETR